LAGIIIVSGAIANKYRSGGEAWVRLSWAMGLRRLGFDVYLVEQIVPKGCTDTAGAIVPFEQCVHRDYFREVVRTFGFADRASLLCIDENAVESAGVDYPALLDAARSCDLLVNISGHLTHASLLLPIRHKAYIDIDPGYTQFWHADPSTPYRLDGHDTYFTIAANIDQPGCDIPTGGIEWRTIRQPVVLDDWPVVTASDLTRFTTIASWRGAFGPAWFGGRSYGLKVHEFRKFIDLPRRSSAAGINALFEIALDIHPADGRDRDALAQSGWKLTDPVAAAGDPLRFRDYVQTSAAEFSVAQGVYVDTHSGWFSDRSIRYLASGKPVLVQETGFSRDLPSGMGLVPFKTMDDAIAGARSIVGDYAGHATAARRIAEQCFDSDRVLKGLLEATL
jgi:hypothetical protein